MNPKTTQSGRSVAYHKREAGNPNIHHGGPWFFEPAGNYSSGEVYSIGFPSLAAALEAAEEWEQIESHEDAHDDSAFCCPNRETPNQFGGLCGLCVADRIAYDDDLVRLEHP